MGNTNDLQNQIKFKKKVYTVITGTSSLNSAQGLLSGTHSFP